jgi:hypothetical protein
MKFIPKVFLKHWSVIALVSLTMRLEPIAFGYSALTSPLRPMPWPSPRFLSYTSLEKIRPSRSPTPQLP